MKITLLFLGMFFTGMCCFSQQNHVVFVKAPPATNGAGGSDAVMTKESFATYNEAKDYRTSCYKNNKSNSISVYLVRANEVGIIYEWKEKTGNKLCNKIAVAEADYEANAMSAFEKANLKRTGVNIIGYINTAGVKK